MGMDDAMDLDLSGGEPASGNEDTGQEGQPGQESTPGQPSPEKTPNYGQDIGALRTMVSDLTSKHDQLMTEVKAKNAKIAEMEEENRKRTLRILGDKDLQAEEAQKRNQEKIKEGLKQLGVKFTDESGGQAASGIPDFSKADLATRSFIQQQANSVRGWAETEGVKHPAAKDLVVTAVDFLIAVTPAWRQRLYQQGDVTVVDEVKSQLKKILFDPLRQAVEQDTLARLRKQKRLAAPAAPTSGKGAASGEGGKGNPPDYSREGRKKFYGEAFNAIQDESEG
jgi:hypothetical protein